MSNQGCDFVGHWQILVGHCPMTDCYLQPCKLKVERIPLLDKGLSCTTILNRKVSDFIHQYTEHILYCSRFQQGDELLRLPLDLLQVWNSSPFCCWIQTCIAKIHHSDIGTWHSKLILSPV